MELFIAGDESQWDIIKEWIDESDVYMLIIGGRYGSIEPKSGKSYTHLEYEYALSVSKPHFVIIIDDETTQNKAKKYGGKITDFFDNSPDLKELKNSIMKGKLVSICENLDKMESSIHKSINKLSQRENLKGWVKADDTDLGASLEELARLSKENSELKNQLDEANKVNRINGMEISEMIEYLKKDVFNDSDKMIYFLEGKYFSAQNSLELFMCLGKEPQFKGNKFLSNNRGCNFLMNLNLITTDAMFTQEGTRIFTYMEKNHDEWKNNIEVKDYNAFGWS